MRARKAIFAAVLLAASPLALVSGAQAQVHYGQPGYHPPPPGPGAPGYHGPPPPHAQPSNSYAWRKKGGRLPHGHGYVVNDYGRHGLRAPPRGYHWVRDGNSYILAGITSGIISSILAATH